MGKIVKWIGIFIGVLLIVLIAAPFLFKGQIVQTVKDTANEELNAVVDFGDFDLTLISSFPDFTFSINDLSVANVGDFEGDTLFAAKQLVLGVDLMSVINGEEYKINTIALHAPSINVKVLKDGSANYDIAKASSDTTEVEEEVKTEEAPFKMKLKELIISEAHIKYDDASADISTEIVNFSHSLSGDFSLSLIHI